MKFKKQKKKKSSVLYTSRIHPFALGNCLGTSFIIGNVMIIRVTSVEHVHGYG